MHASPLIPPRGDVGGTAAPAPWVVGALLGLMLVLFLAGLGSPPLLDPDEGRHAEIAREMLAGGQWLLPRFNGEPYFEKPAGFYWLVAAAFGLFGVSESSARLPSALAAGLAVLLTWRAARRLHGARTGIAAAAVLASSILFLALGRMVLLDVVFAALVGGAFLSFALWLDAGARTFPFFPCVALGAAVLVKGPVALVLAALAFALHFWRDGDHRALRTLRPIAALAVCVAVALPWYAAAALADPAYVADFLWRNHVLRFLNVEGVGKGEPLLYFAYVLPASCLPWSLFWPAILTGPAPRRRSADRFLACGVFVVVLFFSLSRSKLPTYVLPAFPALAVLFARRVLGEEGPRSRAFRVVAAWIWAAALLAGPLLTAWLLPPDLAAIRPLVLSAAAAAVPAIGAAVLARRRSAWLAFTFLSVVVLGALVLGLGAGPLGRSRSGRDPGRMVATGLPVDARVFSLEFRSNGLRFYAARPVERLDSLAAAGARLDDAPPAAVALRTWHRHELPDHLHRAAYLWWIDWPSHRMLVVNRPPPSFVKALGRFDPASAGSTLAAQNGEAR